MAINPIDILAPALPPEARARGKVVRLLDQKPRAKPLKRAAPGTGPEYEYGVTYRAEHAAEIAANKVRWKNENREALRVYNRIWQRTKRGGTSSNYLRGTSNQRAVLTDELVLEMRARHAAGGVTQARLALDYGVAQSRVSTIINGKAWTHILPKAGD